MLLTTDIVRVGNYRDARGFDSVSRRVALCRTWGNCYGYAQVAMFECVFDELEAERPQFLAGRVRHAAFEPRRGARRISSDFAGDVRCCLGDILGPTQVVDRQR